MPPLWLIAGGGALIFGTIGGWTVRDWKADADQVAAIKKGEKVRDELQAQLDAKAVEFETFAAANQTAAISGRNTIERIYRNVPVPANCAVPAAASGVLESARERANRAASGELESAVPTGTASARPTD